MSTAPATARRNWSIRLGLVVLAVCMGATLSACLGPNDPDPTGRNPFGALDSMVADGEGVRMRGWAIDPSTSDPVVVTAWRDGKRVDGLADSQRPDVGHVYPQFGSRHGYDIRFGGLTPGVHKLCVSVDNVGPGEHTRVLGCGDVVVTWSPHGRWDVLRADPDGRVTVAGWARDPDSAYPIDVGVILDGAMVSTVRSDLPPSWVPTAVGLGTGKGFSVDFAAPPGNHEVCIVMANVGRGVDSWLGCQTVNVPAAAPDRRPVGALAAVQTSSRTSIRVHGTAADPDTSAPVQVRLRLTGPGTDRTVTTSTGPGGVFDVTVASLGDGGYKICPVLVDAPAVAPWPGSMSGDRSLPCGSAVLGPDGLGTTGSSVWAAEVKPPPGHPNERVQRDAGISVTLFDETVLWLFGDSLEVNAANATMYFRNNTAALAYGSEPDVTRDAVLMGAPATFVTPSPSHAAAMQCPPSRPNAGLWPMSASAGSRSGSSQKVVAFFANMCMGGPMEFEDRGISVVEWTYTAGVTVPGSVLTGQVTREFLFPPGDGDWGTASWTQSEGGQDILYGYDCADPPPTGGIQFPNAWGRCTVGRVPVTAVTELASWRWWNGSSWSADRSSLASMAGIPDPSPSTDSKAPIAAFNVAFDPDFDRYLMTYSPWPGFTDEIFIRASRTPVGPWSEPLTVQMPGCMDKIGQANFLCYAAGSHTSISRDGGVGLGYYDQLVSPAPPRGAYRATRIPLVVRAFG